MLRIQTALVMERPVNECWLCRSPQMAVCWGDRKFSIRSIESSADSKTVVAPIVIVPPSSLPFHPFPHCWRCAHKTIECLCQQSRYSASIEHSSVLL